MWILSQLYLAKRMTYIFIFTFTTIATAESLLLAFMPPTLFLLVAINKLGIIFQLVRYNHIETARLREHFHFAFKEWNEKKIFNMMATTENVNKRNALQRIGLWLSLLLVFMCQAVTVTWDNAKKKVANRLPHTADGFEEIPRKKVPFQWKLLYIQWRWSGKIVYTNSHYQHALSRSHSELLCIGNENLCVFYG